MTTQQRLDHAYGRQGGRIVKTKRPVTTGPPCDTCRKPMIVGQRERHHLCDPDSLVGHKCTCPPRCTDLTVGDAGICRDDCHPCTIRAGTPYTDTPGWGRQKAPT